jgi:hypothetical protein
MVKYMSFYGVLKIQIFAQNSYVLAYGFTQNRQFRAKPVGNSIFCRDTHIADW